MISASLEYDPFEDITSLFSSKDSLNDIDVILERTRNYKLSLQKTITENNSKTKSQDGTENDPIIMEKVFKDFVETQTISARTEATISNLTQRISYLDNGKNNITKSLTIFQNLKTLVDSYCQCKLLIQSNSYIEMVSPYRIMCSLAENTFIPFKSVDEINRLLISISRLKNDTVEKIKSSYSTLFQGNFTSPVEINRLEGQLKNGASVLVDSDSNMRSKFIDWIIDKKLLYELTEIFQVDDEAGSLENLSRRFIYFKKILNNFNTNFNNSFPDDWKIPSKLTLHFLNLTARDLKILLKRELHDKSTSASSSSSSSANASNSIDLFMNALQSTLDFEKYINIRFSNKFKDESKKLSGCFEPYLSIWVSHQDKIMKDKMINYLSSPKISSSITDSLIVPSSIDLFRTYRSILSQTLELLEGNNNENTDDNKNGNSNSILLTLAIFFNKWLTEYSIKILNPLILPDNIEIPNKLECSKYTVLLINTTDYVSTTISQLEDKLSEFSSSPDRISHVFEKTKNTYNDLLARATNLLIYRVIAQDISFVWKEFNNVDWIHVRMEDYSRYMTTLRDTLITPDSRDDNTDDNDHETKRTTLEYIISLFNRDVYKWNFLDKIIELIANDFITRIIKLLEPQTPFLITNTNVIKKRKYDVQHTITIGEQLLLDIELLKFTLHSLSNCIVNDRSDVKTSSSMTISTSRKRFENHVDVNVEQLLSFVKLLVAPLNSPDDYFETYRRLCPNNNRNIIWAYCFVLKGVEWDLPLWKNYFSSFHLGLVEEVAPEEGNRGDQEKKQEKTNHATNKYFIFQWNKKLLFDFERNLLQINEPNWVNFIRNDLNIKSPPQTTNSRAAMSNRGRPETFRGSEDQETKKPLSVKDLMSTTRFFNRGL
ncbi:Vps53p NDAI_0C03720 [Naumovozyma dairenensis CBS 421]|uniref:Vps53 N-terminal domain-containing protein n=1 Tax=Naumovozyma dairenensis (strain ATCC 10597 / BCRC 20456 / CBS 421 / NBRC 0211 / NRRL Y-12639) TaxID=1071378 RepID=G0W8C1_NAUDC|nr:hypothetical protein NDAI_0C03720 [Naumovozyma dairenensis CBS 421]CCD24032.1 hypothetical protein NDAI_0C03720 [Naumovozyma dairenensis CBS 421]